MKFIFEDQDTEAALLVDTTNAINRKSALHNVSVHKCSSTRIAIHPVRLFITNGREIQSTEGTTQGDPLAMAMYAIATVPLIRKLKEMCPEVSMQMMPQERQHV